jgi:hypothetical protein
MSQNKTMADGNGSDRQAVPSKKDLQMAWRKQRQVLAATYASLMIIEDLLELPKHKRTKRPY